MSFLCWAGITDAGLTSKQHWVNVSCLLGYLFCVLIHEVNVLSGYDCKIIFILSTTHQPGMKISGSHWYSSSMSRGLWYKMKECTSYSAQKCANIWGCIYDPLSLSKECNRVARLSKRFFKWFLHWTTTHTRQFHIALQTVQMFNCALGCKNHVREGSQQPPPAREVYRGHSANKLNPAGVCCQGIVLAGVSVVGVLCWQPLNVSGIDSPG